MSHPLPTQFELRCGGISLMIAQILWMIAFWLQVVDHDLFNTATDEEVINFHKIMSSTAHRTKIEISCVLLWISFPLLLAAIHGIKKISMLIFQGTPGELLMSIAEKAFTLYVGIALVLIPSIALTITSFDWDYVSVDKESGIAPNAYWIQLYLAIYEIEIIDCLAVCDATFMLSYWMTFAYFLWASHNGRNKKFEKLNAVRHSVGIYKKLKYCLHFLVTCFCVSLTVVFLMILFEFAESGFFSPISHFNAGLLVIWSFIVKIFIGFRMIQSTKQKQWKEIKRIFGVKSDESLIIDREALSVVTDNYKMERINVEIDDTNKTNK